MKPIVSHCPGYQAWKQAYEGLLQIKNSEFQDEIPVSTFVYRPPIPLYSSAIGKIAFEQLPKGYYMKKENPDTVGRRSLMSGLGAAAIAGVALGATPASAQNSANRFEAKRHALDSWMAEIPGVHRVFIDTSDAAGGANALRYCSNILNAHVNAYAGSQDEMAMIICYRHASTPFGFNDAMWEKYGEGFAGFTQQTGPNGEIQKQNPLLSSIEGLVDRGVKFAICNSATLFLARTLAEAAGLTADEVHAELTANGIPASRFVPAGVMAVTRAQEYGYSLLYSAR